MRSHRKVTKSKNDTNLNINSDDMNKTNNKVKYTFCLEILHCSMYIYESDLLIQE